MGKDSVVEFRAPEAIEDPLTELPSLGVPVTSAAATAYVSPKSASRRQTWLTGISPALTRSTNPRSSFICSCSR